MLADRVPVGPSAKPTLSVRVRSPEPVERTVTLSYITNNFDWQADYIAELSPGGDRISLFGWLTMANSDLTALENASAQAVAGKLNRERVWVEPGEARPITITCWPQGTTSDIPEASPVTLLSAEDITVTGSRVGAPPPPPPPPPPAAMAERGGFTAAEERLGEVRLYRVPISVTVAAKSQKQIALLRQPAVRIESILRLRPHQGPIDGPLERVLITRNTPGQGLGLAIPAGKLALFGQRGGRRILLGEGRIDDHTVGEKVEIPVATATGVRAVQRVTERSAGRAALNLVLSNDLPAPQTVEIELPLQARSSDARLQARNGWKLWRAIVPANGRAELNYELAGD
jgi:hypothetical protein